MPDRMTAYLQDLRGEIEADPKTIGYEGKTKEEIADLLNTVGGSGETVNAGVLDSYLVVNELEVSEVESLTASQQRTLTIITSAGQVDSSNSKIQAAFLNLFGTGTTTRANLIALSKRSASRREVLEFPITIQAFHVGRALELPEEG